jgi:negative regulator of flagellin synthesis FlgM
MKIPGYDSGINELRKAKVREAKSDRNAPGKSSEGGESVSKSSGASTVSVSSKGRDIQKSSEIAKSAPDIRSEKVDRISREVKAGTYRIESGAVAEKILKDVLSQ